MTTNTHPLTVAPEGLLPLCADMATDLPQAVRLQRLVAMQPGPDRFFARS